MSLIEILSRERPKQGGGNVKTTNKNIQKQVWHVLLNFINLIITVRLQ